MLDLSVYKLGFAPVLAALVVLAFSLEGVPEPFAPGPVTAEFDGSTAMSFARQLAREQPDREAGSDGDRAAADLVAERFGEIATGRVHQQPWDQRVNGERRELRNVALVLPGRSDESILVVAGRDTRTAPGFVSSAAATGVLVELALELGAADRERTIILASTDGSAEGATGVRRLLDGLPERLAVRAAVVISQPAAAELREPHLITQATTARSTNLQLAETAASLLETQAEAPPGLDGVGGQLASLAFPHGLGEQGPLIDAGVPAVAISSAGMLPLSPELDTRQHASQETVDRLGRATLATVNALAAAPGGLSRSPGSYLRMGDNLVPGWAAGLLALALLAPPAAMAFARLGRDSEGGRAGTALGWAASWALPGIAVLAAVFALDLVGLVPSPPWPYDPATISVGATELLALLLLAAIAIAVILLGPTSSLPPGPSRATLAAAAALAGVAACAVIWIANPFLALLAAPLPHLLVAHAGTRPLPRLAVAAVAVALALPLALAFGHVMRELAWGASAPWQLVAMLADGQISVASAAMVLALAGSSIASILAAGRRTPAPEPTPRAKSKVVTPRQA